LVRTAVLPIIPLEPGLRRMDIRGSAHVCSGVIPFRRSASVGYEQKLQVSTVACLSGAFRCTQPCTEVKDLSPVPGLVPWLRCLGLSSCICLAACWAEAHGACELDELVEHFELFTRALGVKGGAWRRQQALEAATEVKLTLLRAASSVLQLPRAMSAPVHHTQVMPRNCVEVQEPRPRVDTAERHDERPDREDLHHDSDVLHGDAEDENEDDDPIFCRHWPLHSERRLSRRRRYRRPRRVRPCMLADAEELRRAVLRCQSSRDQSSQPESEAVLFKRVLDDFRRRYASELLYAFGADAQISPAPVSNKVQSQLMRRLASESRTHLVLGYHGTARKNYPSIFARGLLIPGEKNGLRVANGSAYGNGIYTASAGEAPMSKSYIRCDSMLVCGVLRHRDGDAAGTEPADAASVRAAVEWRIGRPPKRPSGWTSASSYQPPTSSQQGVVRDGAVADHGRFMVTFDEACVAPLFVVAGIRSLNQGPLQTDEEAPVEPSARARFVDLWPEGGNPNVGLEQSGPCFSSAIVKHMVRVRRRLLRKSTDRCRQQAREHKRLSSLAG